MPTFAYNQGEIFYKVAGHGEPIVFVHGFALDHRMWQPQVEFFQQTHKVITYDVRGFGKSSVPSAPYDHVDDLFALLKHLNIPSVHIVGLSMGGRISINFTLAHPQMVRSLTLLDTALDGYSDSINWDVDIQRVSLAEAKINWLNHAIFTYTMQIPKATKLLQTITSDYSGWHWRNSGKFAPKTTQAISQLSTITTPTLVVVGEKDLPDFHKVADIIATEALFTQKHIVKHAGHMVAVEAPDVINFLIKDFMTFG